MCQSIPEIRINIEINMAKFQGTSSKRSDGNAKKKSAIGTKIKLKNKKRDGKSHHRY